MREAATMENACAAEQIGRALEKRVSSVVPNHLIAYPAGNGVLRDGQGNSIGTWKAVSSWRVNSWMGPMTYQIEARVRGFTYMGRGGGVGLVFRGKRG
jgi:hypothetical protein